MSYHQSTHEGGEYPHEQQDFPYQSTRPRLTLDTTTPSSYKPYSDGGYRPQEGWSEPHVDSSGDHVAGGNGNGGARANGLLNHDDRYQRVSDGALAGGRGYPQEPTGPYPEEGFRMMMAAGSNGGGGNGGAGEDGRRQVGYDPRADRYPRAEGESSEPPYPKRDGGGGSSSDQAPPLHLPLQPQGGGYPPHPLRSARGGEVPHRHDGSGFGQWGPPPGATTTTTTGGGGGGHGSESGGGGGGRPPRLRSHSPSLSPFAPAPPPMPASSRGGYHTEEMDIGGSGGGGSGGGIGGGGMAWWGQGKGGQRGRSSASLQAHGEPRESLTPTKRPYDSFQHPGGGGGFVGGGGGGFGGGPGGGGGGGGPGGGMVRDGDPTSVGAMGGWSHHPGEGLGGRGRGGTRGAVGSGGAGGFNREGPRAYSGGGGGGGGDFGREEPRAYSGGGGGGGYENSGFGSKQQQQHHHQQHQQEQQQLPSRLYPGGGGGGGGGPPSGGAGGMGAPGLAMGGGSGGSGESGLVPPMVRSRTISGGRGGRGGGSGSGSASGGGGGGGGGGGNLGPKVVVPAVAGRAVLDWIAAEGFSAHDARKAVFMPCYHRHVTCLARAAELGCLDVARALVRAGAAADVTRSDGRGWTPLIYAAMRGRLEMCRWLVEEAGARDDLTKVDHHDQSPLHWAAAHGHAPVLNFLLAQLKMAHLAAAAAAAEEDEEDEDEARSQGTGVAGPVADAVRALTRSGMSALFAACANHHPEAAVQLVLHGAAHTAVSTGGEGGGGGGLSSLSSPKRAWRISSVVVERDIAQSNAEPAILDWCIGQIKAHAALTRVFLPACLPGRGPGRGSGSAGSAGGGAEASGRLRLRRLLRGDVGAGRRPPVALLGLAPPSVRRYVAELAGVRFGPMLRDLKHLGAMLHAERA